MFFPDEFIQTQIESPDGKFTLNLRLMWTTQMSNTPISKPELGSVANNLQKHSASLLNCLVVLTTMTLVCLPPTTPIVLRVHVPPPCCSLVIPVEGFASGKQNQEKVLHVDVGFFL